MAASRVDYGAEAVEAARSVLLEVVRLLGEYRDHIVLVGGWVPEFIIPAPPGSHCGSMDVDLALDHRVLAEAGYKTIADILLSHGYTQGAQPFVFVRTIKADDREIKVEVDFLAGEYEGTGRSHRTQHVQDIRARKARGCDLALDMCEEMVVVGELPGGGRDSATVRVAGIVPFIVMKGMALADRLKEKDAWDVYYCLLNYPGGLDALAMAFDQHLNHGLVREGLQKIAEKFQSVEHIGPKLVADFENPLDPEERALVVRDAYERVHYLTSKLGIKRT